MDWFFIIMLSAAATGFFYFRDEEERQERALRMLGIRRKKEAPDSVAALSEDSVEKVAPDSLTAAEIEDLVERKFQERLAMMSTSAPLSGIPTQRTGEQVPPPPPPISFHKAPEAVQETLPVEGTSVPHEEPVSPAEPPSRPVKPPVRERLIVPEVKKASPVAAPTSAPHITREDEPLEATSEEKELLEKLAPEVWEKISLTRNLGKTVVESAVLTRAGVQVLIKLNGDWTLPKFQAREESVRMLLEVRKDVMSRITESDKSGWVILSLRTRSACPTFIPWYPGAPLGFCTVTGKEIRVDFRRHLAIAGASNMGKSVTARTIFADVCFDAVAALVYCDPKMVEGALWRGRARVAWDPDQIHDVALELDEENTRRKNIMQQRGWDKWIPSEDEPTLIVPVDEGASLVADAKDVSLEKEEKVLRKQTLAIFIKGAREWRSQGIHIIWMTQYPTVEEGMPQQIGANIPDRISMALGMERHAEVVFDKENVANGWKSHKLPRSPKGLALVKVGEDCEPNPVQVVYLDKDRIAELPLSGIWSFSGGIQYAKEVTDEPEILEEARTAYGEPEITEPKEAVNEHVMTLITRDDEVVVVEEPFTSDEKILMALEVAGVEGLAFQDLMDETSIPKPTLYRLLNALLEKGKVAKGGHGLWKLPSEAE